MNADISAVNGQKVNTPAEVQKIIDSLKPGDQVKIETDYGNATVTLGEAPEKQI